MAEKTGIQWTDATFNPWVGCTKLSPGCTNCYAENETPSRRRKAMGLPLWGPKGGRQLTAAENWQKPLAWNRAAEREGARRKVFCASLADVCESWEGQMTTHLGEPLWADQDGVPRLDPLGGSRQPFTLQHARERLWRLIEQTPHLDWQLLTKRASNMLLGGGMIPLEWAGAWPRNIWAGVSVEDQRRADERIPWLQNVPVRVRFLSIEPLLEPIRLKRPDLEGIDWVIIGGESGDRARPCHLEWVRSLVQQCQAAGVACFVKQLGSRVVTELRDNNNPNYRGVMETHYRNPKGGDPAEWPADLRVRQFPASAALPQSYPNLGATGEE